MEKSYLLLIILWVWVLVFVSCSVLAEPSFVDTVFADTDLHRMDVSRVDPYRLAIFSGVVVGLSAYSIDQFQEIWGRSTGRFHFKEHDWNGDNLAQSDEVSHLVLGYRATQLGINFARWTGMSDGLSRAVGAGISAFYMTLVEYPIDAYNPYQGLGISDLIFDYVGVGFGLLRDKYEPLRQYDMKIEVKDVRKVPKKFFSQSNREYDYYIYWLTYSPYLGDVPLNFGVGYSTDHSDWRNVKRELWLGVGTSVTDVGYLFGTRWRQLFDVLGLLEFSLRVQVLR